MAVRSLVTRGYGAGGSIALVVSRGYLAGEAVAPSVDEYAAKGWPARNFYSPYWLGMKPRGEIEQVARDRARQVREAWGIVPPAVERAIDVTAKRLAAKPVSEAAARKQLESALESTRVTWQDDFLRHLEAQRREYEAVREAQREADKARAAATAAERDRMQKAAAAELARRTEKELVERERAETARLTAQRIRRRNAAIAFVLAVA